MEILLIWISCGLLNYFIKLFNFYKDWLQPGEKIFFFTIFIVSIIFGPIGLILSLITNIKPPSASS